MKHSSHKKLFGVLGIGLGLILLSGCTANFCSEDDKAQMAYPYEQGVTVYCTKEEYDSFKAANPELIALEETQNIAGKAIDGNDNVYSYVPYKVDSNGRAIFSAAKAKNLQDAVLENAYKSGYNLPSVQYWAEIDKYVLEAAMYMAELQQNNVVPTFNVEDATNVATPAFKAAVVVCDPTDSKWSINPYTKSDSDIINDESAILRKSVLRNFGHVKFSGKDSKFFENIKFWRNKLYGELGRDNVPTEDFQTLYVNTIGNRVQNNRSCIATKDGYYGHYGTNANWEVAISRKDWGYAWSKGFLEGLLIFPVSWLVDTFAFSFDANLTGFGQIWALILVTLIVRLLLLGIGFRSTLSQQKMQALKPELDKIQAKYPNANTNQAEKARLGQEQMALYRRHGIHPFGSLLIMIVQFPVFICVWAGLQGSAALSTGQIFNMRLSDNINNILFNVSGAWYTNVNGWWTALVLFILMATVQIFSIILPRIIQKRAAKKVAKTSANPNVNDQQRQMRLISYMMVGFTVIMGFMLPSAMGVYWLISGLISMIQTLIMQTMLTRKPKQRRK